MQKFVLCLGLLFAAVSYAEADDSKSGIEPVDLRCEYLVNPLGIDTRIPRLSWKIASFVKVTAAREVGGQAGQLLGVPPSGGLSHLSVIRGLKQTAYQILVASSEELLKQDKGDLWDSGKVESAQSVNVEYAGKTLTSNQRCFWKVRIWVSSLLSPTSPLASSWSARALFSMGLLDPSDWKGEWIRFQEADNIKHIWYRKSFSLDTIPEQGFAYLASIGYHELFVNGERIGDRVLSPGVTDLEKRVLYVTYDITSKLKKGDNVIAVWTGPGWARSDGSYKKGVWKQDSIFKCQVNFSNGMKLHTDATWKCKVSSSENLGLWKGGGQGEYGGEMIDARRYVADWNLPSYDDSGWSNATCRTKSLILSAEMQEPDRKVATLAPVTITETNSAYRIDFGRNFTGWFEIDLRDGKEGQLVKIMTANRKEEILEFRQESHYIFDATGKGTFSHRFNYMAGRWVTIEGLSYKPEAKDIRGYIITNDRKRIGHFECSNPLFNEIYETDLRTYIACSVNGVTMDCPHRERFGYGEVALACTWGCAIPNFESAAYYRKVAQDWFDVQREDGFVNTIAPQVYKGAGGTLWSSAPVTMSWEYFRAYGDKRQLETAYEPMKKWLDFLNKSVSSNGVLVSYESASRFLGDWATPHGSEYGNTPAAQLFNNCVYAYCLDVFTQAAGVLGRQEDFLRYSARLVLLQKSVHKAFFNEETKSYLDGRQLSQAFPLYTGITPGEEYEAVYKNFVEEITVRKPYLDTGSSGLPILLKYLVEDREQAMNTCVSTDGPIPLTGYDGYLKQAEILAACLNRKEYPGYGYFLANGETAWPEYWKIEGESSRIHTCYTGISGYFMRGLGGIRPDPTEYGMKRFLIKPAPVKDLTWVKCQHESLYGLIVSNWRREGSKLSLEVTVPPNTIAIVWLPTSDSETITESGLPLAKASGVFLQGVRDNIAILWVESGTYRFTSNVRQ